MADTLKDHLREELLKQVRTGLPVTCKVLADRSVGDSYDNALAETVIGLFKTDAIRRLGPGRNLEAAEFATLEWADWFDHRRLLEPIGNIPSAEAEARYYDDLENLAVAAQRLKPTGLRQTRRGPLRIIA